MILNSLDRQKITKELLQAKNRIRRLSLESLNTDERVVTTKLGAFLGDVDSIISRTYQEISKIESKKKNIVKDIFKDRQEIYKNKAREFLRQEIIRACGASDEFGREPFRGSLLRVANHPEIAKISFFYEKPFVDYRMDEIAGTKFEYYRVVEAASKIRKEKIPEPLQGFDPGDFYRLDGPYAGRELSSVFWEEKIYDDEYSDAIEEGYAGKYEEIISLRFSLFTNEAPFWSLLDEGNMSKKRADGIPGRGRPYPKQEPTFFTLKAANKTNLYMENDLKREKNKSEKLIDEDIKFLEDALDVYNSIFQDIMNIDENIRMGIQQRFSAIKEAVYNRALNNIIKSKKAKKEVFTEEMRGALEAKAEETAYKILRGDTVERAYLGSYGAYPVRVRTVDILKDVSKSTQFKTMDQISLITDSLISRIENSVQKYDAIRRLVRRLRR